jgi:hypothetical protein
MSPDPPSSGPSAPEVPAKRGGSAPAADVRLDGSVAPDVHAVREAWRATVAAPERLHEDNRELFRKVAGVTSPSSIVGSAEGITQFTGLYENGNGKLSDVARKALRAAGPEAFADLSDHRLPAEPLDDE